MSVCQLKDQNPALTKFVSKNCVMQGAGKLDFHFSIVTWKLYLLPDSKILKESNYFCKKNAAHGLLKSQGCNLVR